MTEGGHGSGLKCPKCGCELLVQGEAVWCSLVPGDTTKGCDWGIVERKTLAEYHKSALTQAYEQGWNVCKLAALTVLARRKTRNGCVEAIRRLRIEGE